VKEAGDIIPGCNFAFPGDILGRKWRQNCRKLEKKELKRMFRFV
jgi:hypothetical protein